MIDISVTDLVKSFDLEKKILDGVSFQIDTGERVGLLGKNGAGKSTLFNILTGELDYDSGQVLIAPGRRVGLISQIPVYPEGYTVEDVLRSAFQRTTALKEEMDRLTRQMEQGDSDPQTLRRYGELTARFEGLGGYDTDTAVNKVSNGLSIDGDMRQRLFDQLSGGEKTRVNLGRLILEDTDILLLDEPTNHLDLQATEWLEEYIRSFRGTVVTISHDRYFLDKITQRTLVLEDKKIKEFLGNYTYYREKIREAEERAAQELAEREAETATAKPKPAAAAAKAEPPAKKGPARKEPSYGTALKLEKIEMKIAELEATLKMYEVQMNLPDVQTDADKMMELTRLYDETQAQLDAAYETWEQLSE